MFGEARCYEVGSLTIRSTHARSFVPGTGTLPLSRECGLAASDDQVRVFLHIRLSFAGVLQFRRILGRLSIANPSVLILTWVGGESLH